MDIHGIMQRLRNPGERSRQTGCFRDYLQQHEFELAGGYRACELQHHWLHGAEKWQSHWYCEQHQLYCERAHSTDHVQFLG